MKRIVGVAACLLLGAFLLVWLTPSACACSRFQTFKMSDLVLTSPELSVGLVTVMAGGGEVRTNPTTGGAETSIRVAVTNWVGTVPTTLWVNEDYVSSSGLSLEAFRPGTQWVVRVHNADAGIGRHPLPVVGNTVRLPWKYIKGDVEGPTPEVVNLDELRGMARKQQP
jgi:hypothetical protein